MATIYFSTQTHSGFRLSLTFWPSHYHSRRWPSSSIYIRASDIAELISITSPLLESRVISSAWLPLVSRSRDITTFILISSLLQVTWLFDCAVSQNIFTTRLRSIVARFRRFTRAEELILDCRSHIAGYQKFDRR